MLCRGYVSQSAVFGARGGAPTTASLVPIRVQIEPIPAVSGSNLVHGALGPASADPLGGLARHHRPGPGILAGWIMTGAAVCGVMAVRMADIGRPEREIDVRPRELPLPRELPIEPPAPAPDAPRPAEEPVPA